MDKKPEKWRDLEESRKQRLLTFRLYCDVHWVHGQFVRRPNQRPHVERKLKPEIQEWLDEMNFPHVLKLRSGGRSLIRFKEARHAMLFKLRWYKL